MKGSPERQVFDFVKSTGSTSSKDINDELGAAGKLGFGTAMKHGWITMDKGTKAITATAESIADEVQNNLNHVKNGNIPAESILGELKKRKLIMVVSITSFEVKKGEKFSLSTSKKVADITVEMLQKGTWADTEFKDYNLSALGS